MIEVIQLEIYNPTTAALETLRVTSAPDYFDGEGFYLPIIAERFDYSERLFDRGATSGEASVGVGTVALGNTDGILDKYKTYGFDGRAIRIYRLMSKTEPLSDSNLYFTGTVSSPEFGWKEVILNIQNRMEILNVPMQEATLAGTNSGAGGDGGYEGSEESKDQIKPQVFGRCACVEGVVVNQFWLMYGFNFDREGARKPVYKFYSVHVKGMPYFYSSDYATADALKAATIGAGYYSTCVAEGLIRLGSVPADNGKVVVALADRADAECTAGAVVARVLEDNAEFVATQDFSTDGLALLDNFNPCTVGYYVTGNESIASVVNALLDSVGGWCVPNEKGVFEFGLIDLPAVLQGLGQQSVFELSSYHWADSIERAPVGDEGKSIPATAVTLYHTKNWATQDAGALAGAVPLKDREFFTKEFRQVKAEAASVKTVHPLAPSLEFYSLMNDLQPFSLLNARFTSNLSSEWQTENGSWTRTNDWLEFTPDGFSQGTITQELLLNGGAFYGDTEVQFKVAATYPVICKILRDGGEIFSQTIAAPTVDSEVTLQVSLPPAISATTASIQFCTVDENTSFKIANVRWHLARVGKSPEEECNRRLVKESTFTERYVMDVADPVCQQHGIRPGRLVTLQDDKRFGLEEGKVFLVIGADRDGDSMTTTLDVWG